MRPVNTGDPIDLPLACSFVQIVWWPLHRAPQAPSGRSVPSLDHGEGRVDVLQRLIQGPEIGLVRRLLMWVGMEPVDRFEFGNAPLLFLISLGFPLTRLDFGATE